MMRSELPPCVSRYATGNKTCNGNEKGKTEFEQAPCAWRDRCGAFKTYLKETGEAFEEHVELKKVGKGKKAKYVAVAIGGRSAFLKFCKRASRRFGIVDGLPTKGTEELRKPKRKRKMKAVRLKRAKLQALFDHFLEHLCEALPEAELSSPMSAAAPGELYVLDRTDASRYISVYYCRAGRRDIPIARGHFKPRTLSLDLELPMTAGKLKRVMSKRNATKLNPKPVLSGAFRCEVRGVGKIGLALIAEAIGRLVKKGLFELD